MVLSVSLGLSWLWWGGVRSLVEAPPPIPRCTRSNSFAQERWVSDMWPKTSRRSSYQINDLVPLPGARTAQVLAGTTGHLSHPPPSTPIDHIDDMQRRNVYGCDGRIWRLLVSTAWTGSSFICIKAVRRSYQGAARDTEGLGCHTGDLKTHFGA